MINKISNICSALKNRTKLVRKRSAHRFKIFLRYTFKKAEKEPVFIIAARRTGSNLLLGYLNSIPGVSFAPEILNKSMYYGIRSRSISKQAVLRHIAHSINYCQHRVCGAKLIKVQLESHGIVLNDLKTCFPKARFIILYRRSLLDQFVSLQIAEATNTWQWTNKFRLPPSVTIQAPKMLAYCETMKKFYRDIIKPDWLKECSVMLSYEELVSSPQKTFERKMFPFLRLANSPVFSHTKKQNTKKLHDIIQNYPDIFPWIGHASTLQEYSFSDTTEEESSHEPQILLG